MAEQEPRRMTARSVLSDDELADYVRYQETLYRTRGSWGEGLRVARELQQARAAIRFLVEWASPLESQHDDSIFAYTVSKSSLDVLRACLPAEEGS